MDITNEFLNKTLEYLNSAEAFLQKNVPAFVEELLVFDFYQAVFYSVHPIIMIGILVTLVYYSFRISTNSGGNYSSDTKELVGIAGGCTGLVLIVVLIYAIATVPDNIMTAVKIKVAPRVYLVEKISSMVRK